MRFNYGALLFAFTAIGCDAPQPPASSARPKAPFGTQHSALSSESSSISGRVTWVGRAPIVAPITALRSHADASYTQLTRPSPNVPAVGPDGAVAGAVVFLRGIDPSAAREWDRPPVTIEMHDERPMIRQGDGPPDNIGFVRRGDEITIVSRQELFHSLRARGAAFWTVTLPEANRPRSRKLDQPGVVELSSGAYYFWMRGYVWVCEHPYYAVTDAAGRWSLTGVPPGEYELVTWLPDWRTERKECDPDTGLVARYVFQPPLEVTRHITVGKNETVTIGDVQIRP